MTRLLPLAALLLCVAAPDAAGQKSAAQRDLRAELVAMNDSLVAAFHGGSAAAVARFYADDARMDGERGQIVQGRAAIDRFWAEVSNPKSWKLDVLAVGGRPDQPYEIGRSTIVTSGPNGDRVSSVEYLLIWRRDARGRLRIIVDYFRF